MAILKDIFEYNMTLKNTIRCNMIPKDMLGCDMTLENTIGCTVIYNDMSECIEMQKIKEYDWLGCEEFLL